MPASMTIALVASRPKVTGNRMLMPDKGPIPGSTPTSVPTTQPRKPYHSTSGRNATVKPSTQAVEGAFHRSQNPSRPCSSGVFNPTVNRT